MSFHLFLLFVSFLLTACTVKYVAAFLIKKDILDRPNHRSSHTIPTPRGGGLGVMPVLIAGWAMIAWSLPVSSERTLTLVVCALTVFLCVILWFDDHRPEGLSARFRLLSQVIAVSVPLYLMPSSITLFDHVVPVWIERVLLGFGWVWYINLFNFMDGINGISGQQASMNALAIAGISYFSFQQASMPLYGMVMAGCGFGFLVWNFRRKALIFLGDIGSAGFGYSLGWLFILLSIHGFIVSAIIISLYYLVDSTYTLCHRFMRGATIWEAHREHFYQKAVNEGGMSHVKVSGLLMVTNIVLGIIAYSVSIASSWMMQSGLFLVAVVCVVSICTYFNKKAS